MMVVVVVTVAVAMAMIIPSLCHSYRCCQTWNGTRSGAKDEGRRGFQKRCGSKYAPLGSKRSETRNPEVERAKSA